MAKSEHRKQMLEAVARSLITSWRESTKNQSPTAALATSLVLVSIVLSVDVALDVHNATAFRIAGFASGAAIVCVYVAFSLMHLSALAKAGASVAAAKATARAHSDRTTAVSLADVGGEVSADFLAIVNTAGAMLGVDQKEMPS